MNRPPQEPLLTCQEQALAIADRWHPVAARLPSEGAEARYGNASASAFARSLALIAAVRQRMHGLDPVAAGGEVAALQEQLVAVDASALSNADTWWSLIVEQMRHGLF